MWSWSFLENYLHIVRNHFVLLCVKLGADVHAAGHPDQHTSKRYSHSVLPKTSGNSFPQASQRRFSPGRNVRERNLRRKTDGWLRLRPVGASSCLCAAWNTVSTSFSKCFISHGAISDCKSIRQSKRPNFEHLTVSNTGSAPLSGLTHRCREVDSLLPLPGWEQPGTAKEPSCWKVCRKPCRLFAAHEKCVVF